MITANKQGVTSKLGLGPMDWQLPDIGKTITKITNFFLQVMCESKISQLKRVNTLSTNPSIDGEGRVCSIAK